MDSGSGNRYHRGMDREEALAKLHHVKRLRERAAAETEPAIVAALEAGIGPAEVAAAIGVSDSHVRALRRKHNLPPHPSYAHLKPATSARQESEPADGS